MIVRMFHQICTLLVLMNMTSCYKIRNEHDNTKTTEAVKDTGEEMPTFHDAKLNTSMIQFSTKLDSFNKRTDEIKSPKSNLKPIEIEQLEILINVISKICKVKKYESCFGRENEMNHFTEGSPCSSCSCNPIQCPIAGNCCPDVEAQSVDEADDSVVLPVCIQMYNTLPRDRPTKEEDQNLDRQESNSDKVQQKLSFTNKDILKNSNGNRDNIEPQPERNSAEAQQSYKHTDNQENRKGKDENIKSQQERNSNEAKSSASRDLNNKAINEPKTYKQSKTEVSFPEFLVINKCPNSFDDIETVKKCEENNSAELSAYIPVSVFLSAGPVVYKNKWCAECHNVTSIQNWALVTDCMHFYQSFYLPSDVEEFVKIYQNCTAYTVPPVGWMESSQTCSGSEQSNMEDDNEVVDVADKCNVTGHWDSYDSVVQDLCESRTYLPVYQDTIELSQNVVYKNIFCFTCNAANDTKTTVNDKPRLDKNPESLLGDTYVHMPVNIAKDVSFMSTQTGEKSLTCSSGYVQDSYQDTCIPFQCPVYQTGLGYMCEDKDSSTLGLVLTATLSVTFQEEPVELENTEPVNLENMDPVKLEHPGRPVKFENMDPVNLENMDPVKLENIEQVKLENTESVKLENTGNAKLENAGRPVKLENEGRQVNLENEDRQVALENAGGPAKLKNMGSAQLENSKQGVTDYGHYLNDVIVNTLGLKLNRCNITYVRMLANYTNINTRQVRKLYMEYKITNTETCSVETIVNTFDTVVSTNVTAMVHFANTDENTNLPLSKFRKTSTKIGIGMEFGPVHNTQVNKTLVRNNPGSYEINLHQAFNCPSVLLNITYYKQLVENGSLIPLATSKLETTYTQTTGLVPICYSAYAFQWFAEHYQQRKAVEDSSLTNLLNLLSTLISMGSILLVLLTYFLFPDLHFIPGKLFMMLCVNLFMAQGLFTFGIGLEVDNGWCQFIGMLIHFFWLATIFSMNSNLTLMFSNIKHPLGTSSREMIQSRSNSTVCRYMVYCYLMSAVWVLINVIISGFLLHDDHYGYGGNFCYINTPIMRITTFTLPLILVLLANFVMFTLIISRISASMYKRYCFVFKSTVLMVLKLSTITGVFWLFGFLYEATGMPLFEYLFIILQAGQGFFLMTTYIFNKRVLNLYKAKFLAWRGKKYDITVFPASASL